MLTKTIFGAASALALSIACASPAAAEPLKFDFWYGLTGALGDVIANQCKLFNESQTAYAVNCVGQGGYDKAEQNTIAAYRAQQQPTLVQLYDAGTVNFMLSGAIYPATKFASDYGIKIDWNDYFPAIASNLGTSSGELWSFPYNHSTAMMYYNKDALAKIGKTAPPATFAELNDDILALKAAGYDCAAALDFDAWVNLEQISYTNGLPIATQNNGYDGLDAELVYNTTKVADFLKMEKSWLDAGAAKIMTAQTGKAKVAAFADGSCQFLFTSIADHSTITKTKAEGLNWSVAMLPVFDASKRINSVVGGASIWIMQGKSKEEYAGAAEFIKYIADAKTGVTYMVQNTGYIPVTKSAFKLLTDEGFYKDPAFAGRELALASLEASPVTPLSRGVRLGNYTAIRAAFVAELQSYFNGQKDLQPALDDAVKAGNDILRRYQQTFEGKKLP